MNITEIRNKLKLMEGSPNKEVITFIKPLIKTAVWSELMLSYFGNKKYCDPNFLAQILILDNFKHIEKAIKLKKAFNHSSHWKSFELLKNSRITKYRQLYKEIKYVKENLIYWKEKAKLYIDSIEKYSYEEIIIHFTSYFQKFKNYSKKTPDNQILITSYESILINLLNNFIKQRKSKLINTKKNILSICLIVC